MKNKEDRDIQLEQEAKTERLRMILDFIKWIFLLGLGTFLIWSFPHQAGNLFIGLMIIVLFLFLFG